MVVYKQELAGEEVDRIFHALADATRRDILARTLQRETSLTGLAGRYEMSFAAVQKHVTVLQRAGLVTKERRGREQLIRGHPPTLERAAALLDELQELWGGRVDRIAELLGTEGEPS